MQYVIPLNIYIKNVIWKPVVEELITPVLFIMAICLSNYALASFPNVKLFDFIVFSSGYFLGLRRGATIAVASWYIYGHINPWGPVAFHLLITLMAAEIIYAAAGAYIRAQSNELKSSSNSFKTRRDFFFAAIICTVAYDLLTNIHTGIIWAGIADSGEIARWVFISVFGPGALLFSAIHVSSNALIFAGVGPFILIKRQDIKKRLTSKAP